MNAHSRIHAYLRVSTTHNGQTFDSQRSEIDRYLRLRGLTNITWHQDKLSGAKASRPGLDGLMKAVRKGKVDCVICYKLDRVGRSLSHLALIIEELRKNSVALICTGQGINTADDTAASKLQLDLLCVISAWERANHLERIAAGKRASGKIGGRPKKLRPMLVEKIVSLREQKRTYSSIAAEVGLSISSVRNALIQKKAVA